jgi:hypothetical protein
MSHYPTNSAVQVSREAPRPAEVRASCAGLLDRCLEAWPVQRVLAAMPPGEAQDAEDLLARLKAEGTEAPHLCTLQHRLHEGWIEGFLERGGPDRSRYRRIPGVTAARTSTTEG